MTLDATALKITTLQIAAAAAAVLAAGAAAAAVRRFGRAHRCRPWTPWLRHRCVQPATGDAPPHERLLRGVQIFQRHTAPLVRPELARLAREGQAPSQLFITCADSRVVTSMITNSGPGDLFTVRNVGNLVEDDSVAAAVQYAVDVLQVRSITVCGHSGCGAMQALLAGAHEAGGERGGEVTPLVRWLRNGQTSLARSQRRPARFAGRPADELEQLCLSNVVQQLEHLAEHPAVRTRRAEGGLRLVGMYFDLAAAQAYLLDQVTGVFRPVGEEAAEAAA